MTRLFLSYSVCICVVSVPQIWLNTFMCSIFLVSSVGFTIALHLGFFGFWKFLLWVVLFDCIGVGVLVATLLWLISNHFLLNKRHIESSPVEWAYCFDVHLNALFPLLLILHGVQLLLFGGTGLYCEFYTFMVIFQSLISHIFFRCSSQTHYGSLQQFTTYI